MDKSVFLRKSFKKPGFDILDKDMKLLYTDIEYVQMKDVTFVICEKNKKLSEETGVYSEHAWIEGTLVNALFKGLRLTTSQIKLIDLGIPIEYRPRAGQKGFTITHSGNPISTAKEIIAFNGRVKVVAFSDNLGVST